jgi:ribonuclease BN (tRNA processing enzyme)
VSLLLVTAGTGTVAPSARRTSAAHWVEQGEVRVLMDCGAGALHALARHGLAWERVSHVAITHFHPDHFGELPALLFALRHATRRVQPLVVAGPAGIEGLLDRLAAAFGEWVLDPGFPLAVRQLEPRRSLALSEDAGLEAQPVPHTAESVALSVRSSAGRLVYTGDTGPSEQLGEWARGCDLLLAECSLPEAMAVDLHLTPRQAGALARRSEAGRLVLTHFYPPVEEVDIRSEVAREYQGPVALAKDGDRFVIG